MVDPFSTLASALQIAEVASGLGCQIVHFIRDLKEVDGTTEELFKKLEHLGAVVDTIAVLMKRRNTQSPQPMTEHEVKTLRTMESLLQCCGKDIDAFTKLLAPLKRIGGTSGFNRVTTQARLDWNQRHLCRLEKNVHGNIMLLQTLSSCSEVVIQWDALSRLTGNNDSIMRDVDKVQLDVAKLRSAFEAFACGKTLKAGSPCDVLTRLDSLDAVSCEEAILGRMKAAIKVTESVCDRVSSLGSTGENDSERLGPTRPSAEEAEFLDFQVVTGLRDGMNTPNHMAGTSYYGGNASGDMDEPVFSTIDVEQSLERPMQTTSLNALPLPVMNRLLENYQYQATKDLEDSPPRYEDAERNLIHSLDSGATREHVHGLPFKERFDIVIKLAKAQIGQGKYTSAEHTLLSMRCLVAHDKEKIGPWSCALARLYQAWYSESPDWKLLTKLEEFATQSYNAASQSTSTSATREQDLIDSAGALIALYTWTGDAVAEGTLRMLHPSVVVGITGPAIRGVPDNSTHQTNSLSTLSQASSSGGRRLNIGDGALRRVNTAVSLDDPELSVDYASSLLFFAAKSKCAELVRYHIKRADVNHRDVRQRSPLHIALLGPGGKDVVPILLDHGADVNATDSFGTSPLHICSDLDKDDIARELIQRGAEVDATDKADETPLHIAIRKRKLRMVQCLLNAGATVGDFCKNSGYKEIDFIIREHINQASPSRSASVRSRLFRRP